VPVAKLAIRTFGDPVLRQRSREVERVTDLHRKLIHDMFDTMREAPGVGLAAPQVGVLERIFVWEFEDEYGAFVNPVITSRGRKQEEGEEGCLSLPGVVGMVDRASEVVVEGLDEYGNSQRVEATDWVARIFQHEIDHLDGVLFVDHLPDQVRKEALAILRDQVLGLPTDRAGTPVGESL
jgi:peptide deformylase